MGTLTEIDQINDDIAQLTESHILNQMQKYQMSLIRTKAYGLEWAACSGDVKLYDAVLPDTLGIGVAPHIAIKNCLLKILETETNRCPSCAEPKIKGKRFIYCPYCGTAIIKA